VYLLLNPLESRGNYSAASNKKMTHWPLMGGSQPARLLPVPNVTAHPSKASVPITITVLLSDVVQF